MSTKSVKKTITKVYDDLGVRTKFDPKKKYVYTALTLTEQLESVKQFVSISKEELVFISVYPEKAKKNILNMICNDALEINCNSVMGSFDVDRSNGEIRHRST